MDLLCTQPSNLFGDANPTTKARQLEPAVAFADVGQTEVAKRCLRLLISKSADPEWIFVVGKVELARILYREHQLMPSVRMLEELLPKLLRIKKRWASFEQLEACTILGGCYSSMGRFLDAEKLLLFVVDSYMKHRNDCWRKMVNCVQEIVGFYSSRNDFVLACEAHRVALRILEAEEQDPSRIALANLELARAEVRCCDTSAAIDRFITSIRTLRKRKHDTWASDALPDARKELGNLIKPLKRLRVKTSPEDC